MGSTLNEGEMDGALPRGRMRSVPTVADESPPDILRPSGVGLPVVELEDVDTKGLSSAKIPLMVDRPWTGNLPGASETISLLFRIFLMEVRVHRCV